MGWFPKAMPKIKTESLQPGMVVSSDVKNMDNMLLIPAGGTLTERQIDILNAWGIAEIDVKVSAQVQEEADPLSKLSAEALEKLSSELKSLFWKADEKDPVFQEIFKLILRRRARRSI